MVYTGQSPYYAVGHAHIELPVAMRAAPAVSAHTWSGYNINGYGFSVSPAAVTPTALSLVVQSYSTASYGYGHYVLDARL
jgi:hypothetical protein